MAGRIANGWELTKQSWAVLAADKKLLVFPIISSLACLLLLASFAVPIALNVDWKSVMASTNTANNHSSHINIQIHNPTYYALLFAFYFTNYFLVIFFNSALVACVHEQFKGGTPTIGFGFAAAAKRLPQILLWALVSATVGMILRAIADRSKLLGQIVAGLLGAAWSIATYFAVPVLVVEQAGPFDVFKRSVALLKKSWGEGIVANVSMSLITGLLFLLGLFPLVGAIIGMSSNALPIPLGIALILISVIYWTALGLVSSTLKVILTTALYEYASSGTAPGPFQGDLLQQAFRPKK